MAHVDYFLKLSNEIQGESQDSKHKNEIEVESWSWSESNAGTMARGAGGGAGKVAMGDFHFSMKMCKATPKLFLACATGEHIKEALLTCRKAGTTQQEFMTVKFTDLLVSSYHTGGSVGSDIVPDEQISMNFTQIEVEYKEQKPDGSLGGAVKAGYNLKTQVKV